MLTLVFSTTACSMATAECDDFRQSVAYFDQQIAGEFVQVPDRIHVTWLLPPTEGVMTQVWPLRPPLVIAVAVIMPASEMVMVP